MPEMNTCLWFAHEAEEAAKFYCSVFKDSKITNMRHYPKTAGEPPVNMQPGTVMTIEFEILGRKFTALNGGPVFKFNEAISIMVECDTQAEIDGYFKKLSAVPESEQCGWVKDKFGLSWQLVPKIMAELTDESDPARAERVFNAMLKMKKLDIAALKAAA